MGQLIMVEGLPGTGKTTISGKIAQYLSNRVKTNLYQEGDAHPADLAWCACIPLNKLENIFQSFPSYRQQITANMYQEDGYAVISYTRFPIGDPRLYELMESYEVYDSRVSADVFMGLHKSRWRKFGEQAKNTEQAYVFECALLQNHINEMLLFHNYDETQIGKYLQELAYCVQELHPVIIYLSQPDVCQTLKDVSDVRINEKGEKVWMERVISYIENSPYGLAHSLHGFDGMVTYFSIRKDIELAMLKRLPAEAYIINNLGDEWDFVWNEIQIILDGCIK